MKSDLRFDDQRFGDFVRDGVEIILIQATKLPGAEGHTQGVFKGQTVFGEQALGLLGQIVERGEHRDQVHINLDLLPWTG